MCPLKILIILRCQRSSIRKTNYRYCSSIKTLFSILCLLISFISYSQESEGKYIKDAKTGCKIWDPIYSTDDSISWSGSCKNDLAEGTGTLIWFDKGKENARYVGLMGKGNPNGKGKYTFISGGTLEGNFVDGSLLNLDDSYLKQLQKNILKIPDGTDIFASQDGTKSLFYYALIPKGKIIGVLVLLPSTGESPEEVFSNNVKLTQMACDSGLMTIIPSINNHICLDTNVLDFLNGTFADAAKKYKAPKDKFVIGGLSLGGMLSLRYTEYAYDTSSHNTVIKPQAVFGADPPVDLSNLYYQFLRDVDRNFSPVAVAESKFYIEDMQKQFGGSPKQYPENYIKYSMFSQSEKYGGNAKFLKNVPVRIYCDPDVNWQMKNRHRDYYDMNAPDQTAMILQLQLMGNTKAEFINALGKGYRLDGTRHPHSWSIVEPVGCLAWILKCIK